MTLIDSLMISLIGLTVVFLALILLSLIIKLQSLILAFIMLRKKMDITGAERTDTGSPSADKSGITKVSETADDGWSAGELNLLGVDERTAAMIMAIISHESQIPLSELQFKMIKAID